MTVTTQPGGGGWATDLLAAIQAPPSENNLQKLAAWNACEGNKGGQSGLGINNPFNTTLSGYGGSSVNGAGVKSYPSIAAGVQATVDTLNGGAYKAIRANLQQDGPQSQFASAVGSSPWGTGGSCIAKSMGVPLASASADAGQGGGAGGAGPGCNGCAVNLPSIGPIGGGCLISSCQLKALKGGLLVLAGGGVFIVGGLILVAYGFQRTGAGQAASQALQATPAGRTATRAGSATQRRTGAPAGRREEQTRLRRDIASGKVSFPEEADEPRVQARAAESSRRNRQIAGRSRSSYERRVTARTTAARRQGRVEEPF